MSSTLEFKKSILLKLLPLIIEYQMVRKVDENVRILITKNKRIIIIGQRNNMKENVEYKPT